MDSNKRSTFEEKCAVVLEESGFEYEVCPFEYTVHRKYTPDFMMGDILVECKGWFRPGDRQKYKAIRDSIPGFYTLVFLLMKANKPVQKGAKLTMGGWCEKEGFPWFDTAEGVVNYAVDNR